MSQLVQIQGNHLEVKEYKGQRVVTFKDIDSLHGRPEGTARKRFTDNKKRFIQGKHYFRLTSGDSNSPNFGQLSSPNGLTVITEQGYLLLVKSFTDDLAWEVQEQLVETYFRAKELSKQVEMLSRENRSQAMLYNAKARQAKLMMEMAESFKGYISSESVQLLICGATEILTGKSLLPKPQVDVFFTASEIAEEADVSANKVGRVSNKNNLKTSEYGMWILDKSASSEKQVKTFVYNDKGRHKLIELIQQELKIVPIGGEK